MPTLFGTPMTRRELDQFASDPSLLFGVDMLSNEDGPERGVRMLRFRTGGGMDFDVMVDRAMDISAMRHHGVPVGWHGPAGNRHPAFHQPEAEDGLGWARSVSGLLSTCGLDHIHANTDDTADHYHYALRKRVAHPLHGRIGFTPARLTGYGVDWDGDDAVLFAEGEMRQAALFAENLSLKRRIEVPVGGDEVRILDTVTNLGFDPTPHALVYHVNLGYPVLNAGTELWADIRDTPFEMHSDGGDAIVHDGPSAPFEQRVFEHEIPAGADGRVRVALANTRLQMPGAGSGLAFELSYDPATLPGFFQWQYFQSGNYVTAIEPCSTRAGDRADWLENGQMPMLEHGQTRTYDMAFRCHAGAPALAALRNTLIP